MLCLTLAVGPIAQSARSPTHRQKNLDDEISSKGLFAGLELKGVVIKPDKDDMRDVYGEGVTAKAVLKDNKVTAPVAIRAFPTTLGRYSSRNATE